jgi:hypothetical protein
MYRSMLDELNKIASASSGSAIGALVGLGKGIHDIPARDRRKGRHVARDLALQTAGGALAGGALGYAAKRTFGKVQRAAGSRIRHARKELQELTEKKIGPQLEQRVRRGIAGAPREFASSTWKRIKKLFKRK